MDPSPRDICGDPAKADEAESSSSDKLARESERYTLKDARETAGPSVYKAELGLSDVQFDPEAHENDQVMADRIAAIVERVTKEGN